MIKRILLSSFFVLLCLCPKAYCHESSEQLQNLFEEVHKRLLFMRSNYYLAKMEFQNQRPNEYVSKKNQYKEVVAQAIELEALKTGISETVTSIIEQVISGTPILTALDSEFHILEDVMVPVEEEIKKNLGEKNSDTFYQMVYVKMLITALVKSLEEQLRCLGELDPADAMESFTNGSAVLELERLLIEEDYRAIQQSIEVELVERYLPIKQQYTSVLDSFTHSDSFKSMMEKNANKGVQRAAQGIPFVRAFDEGFAPIHNKLMAITTYNFKEILEAEGDAAAHLWHFLVLKKVFVPFIQIFQSKIKQIKKSGFAA